MTLHRSIVYREPGRFAGWPANYGLWSWGEEVVSVFVAGWLGPLRGVHARDMSRPFEPVQMRSHDGGDTWQPEPFTATIPAGGTSLSGDEHVDGELKVGPTLSADHFVALPEPVDFTDPETIVMCARTDLAAGSWSWFYVSRDRARTWTGPHLLPDLDQPGLSARTDVVALDTDSALFMLTAAKSDGREGRVLCAWTGDGGRTFQRRGWVGEEPDGWTIMPSSRRLPDGSILTSVRRCRLDADGERSHSIDLYRSADSGHTWELLATPVPDTGPGGNPPALVGLPDGTLVLSYGYRAAPFGLRAVTSTDKGRSWSDPTVLTDDLAMRDLGYPRSVVMADGSVLTVFYANQGDETDRYIEAARWTP